MKSTKPKTGIIGALILLGMGVLGGFYLFHGPSKEKSDIRKTESTQSVPLKGAPAKSTDDEANLNEVSGANTNTSDKSATTKIPELDKDTFLISLKNCSPEISAQTVTNPEALLEYLKKNVGIEKEETSVENFHLRLPDGSTRRIHIIGADNTNSAHNKELRFFKLDAEGYPERIPLKGHETLQSLLSLGTLTKHEVKVLFILKDGTSINAEMHDQNVYEFQYNNHGKVFSCRYKECLCR